MDLLKNKQEIFLNNMPKKYFVKVTVKFATDIQDSSEFVTSVVVNIDANQILNINDLITCIESQISKPNLMVLNIESITPLE